MQIIAMGKIKEYLISHLPNFTEPTLLISSTYYPGCSKCQSAANSFYVELLEMNKINHTIRADGNRPIKLIDHTFPFPVYYFSSIDQQIPSKVVVGTRLTSLELELAVLKIFYPHNLNDVSE